MNDADKALARRLLESKRLDVAQVEALRAEAERNGRSFSEVAAERGLLKQGPMPRLFVGLLAASTLIFSGLLVATVYKMRERTQKDSDLAEETSRMMAESERRSTDARRGYERKQQEEREEAARKALARARDAMSRAASKSPAEAVADLNEAFVAYNAGIEVFPNDADLRIERAATHEARRNYDKAVDDLERAILIRKELEPRLRDKIAQLKLFIARKPAR